MGTFWIFFALKIIVVENLYDWDEWGIKLEMEFDGDSFIYKLRVFYSIFRFFFRENWEEL